MRGASGDDQDADDESVPANESAEPAGTADPTVNETTAATSAGTDADGAAADTDTVDPSDIDPSELTVSERSLHPRIRTIWIGRAILGALVLGAIAFGATWQFLEITLLVPAAITVALLALFVTHALLRYRAWQYEFREDAIYLERGVLTRVRTVVPFVRIQHVDTARGPIARAAGLSTLVVYTAGSRGADVTIPGLEADRATDHQRRLKQLAIAAEDDTAV